jgi:holliday junction DNA helicase RuvA
MIAFIKGTVFSLSQDGVIIDQNGMGYYVYFARPERLKLNETCLLYTYHQIREDEHSLYGFLTREERDFFLKLISVKGLGSKTANQILAVASIETLILAIEQGDVDRLKALPGIGNKTASQIILDLKGKLVEVHKDSKSEAKSVLDTLEALKTLGYKSNELIAVEKKLRSHEDKSADELLKLALIELAKR